MLAVAIPSLALVVVGLRIISARHADVREAERVSDQVQVLDGLIDLRSSLFAERVAWEIMLPERRPPEAVLATTDFGRLILDDSGPLELATDQALARLAAEDRPFEPSELARVRTSSADWSRSSDAIRGRLEPLATSTEEVMARYAIQIRDAAVGLGDTELIAAGTTFQRSVRLPDDAAQIVGALSDLWAAAPADRSRLQSTVAAEVSRFATSSQIFAASIVDPSGPVADFWNGHMQVPPTIQRLLEQVEAGDLTAPGRQAGKPDTVGLDLLEAIDWTIRSDELPLIAADNMSAIAARVSDDAREAERTTAVLVVTAITASVAAAVLFGRSILAPVRRLTDHAERIGRGDLDLDPLPLGGPPDVAVASAAVNDVVGSLRLLEQKSRALADIDLDHPALLTPLPGQLGAALQRSTEVLSASIVDREELRTQLQHDATHDSLTGLANRAAFSMAVADLLERDGDAWDAAIVFIDLDGVTQIRNRLGLGTSDEVLKIVAGRISALAPAGGTVARLGGDEFIVLLTGTVDAGGAAQRAREMVDAVAAPIEVEGQVLRLPACAGVASVDDVASPLPGPTDLLQRADLAVNDAKRMGPGTVVRYDGALGRRIARQYEIEVALAVALTPGAQQLRVVYQPIVATTTGALEGLEALVRWDSPSGPVGPDEFVPIAERSGLIVALDMWVLRTVTCQLAAWTDVPHLAAVPVSVNLSGHTLLHPTLVADVFAALGSQDVVPSRLMLEVTETALVTDLALAATQLQQVRSAGIRVAIDDFGTGFTSIAQLRALPVDELKIDISFVRDLADTSNRVLVQMIQDLAELLHLTTVAEGVETSRQVEELAAIGCDALQGYYFSRPVDADAIARWATDRRGATTGD